jgi:uncharacterized protein YjbI with pentapeptide repeats
MPLRHAAEGRKIAQAHFTQCDFSGADCSELTVDQCSFTDCVFDRADMSHFSEHGCTFSTCSFVRADWRHAAIGFAWNNVPPGAYRSAYRDCLFEEIRFARTSFWSPVFTNCRFVFKRLKTIDFNAGGFWGCHFEGAFEDITFRGAYYADSKSPRPPEAGLHLVSFRKAALRWINTTTGCAMDRVDMPEDGSAFLCDVRRLVAERNQMMASCPDDVTREMADLYLDIVKVGADKQPIIVTSRYDLGERDTAAQAAVLYDMLKARYRLGG